MKKIFCAWLAVFALALGLGACGKAGPNTPFEGSGYPHPYPKAAE